MDNWSASDVDGTMISCGMTEDRARPVAQAHADRTGRACSIWEYRSSEDDYEVVEPSVAVAPSSVSTMAGVQEALLWLNYDLGEADGKDGPRTRAAVRAFQAAQGLSVDGVASPKTRARLAAAVAAYGLDPYE
jgi:peptidoglycan hydrolase-like protein with peptidoglycan-binding domain